MVSDVGKFAVTVRTFPRTVNVRFEVLEKEYFPKMPSVSVRLMLNFPFPSGNKVYFGAEFLFSDIKLGIV